MESPLPPDPYRALNVTKDASLATIRTAHRKLVLKTHPDKVQGDEELKKKRGEEFHQIQQAYEILSDDARRKAYDDRVKLATLRAEMMAERGGPRIMSESRPMSGRSPVVEVRGGRVYEERTPRRSYDDHEDDFFSYKPRDSRPKYDDPYDAPPTTRKSSIRLQDEKQRRARDIEEEQRERERDRVRRERGSVKAEKKSVFAERTRQRDKTRRSDYDSKYDGRYDTKYRGATVEEVSDESSGSSDTEVTYQPRKREEIPRHRYEEVRRKEREETPRRAAKYGKEDVHADYLDSKVHNVKDYIKQSREPEIVELRRPSVHKGPSTREGRPTPSPPPASRGTGRSHARRESSPPPKSVAKPRRVTEIVEPAEIRRPSMPGPSSDPKGLRGMTNASSKGRTPRSSTAEYPPEPRQPSIRRSETMPTNRSRHDDYHVSKSSMSKEVDSDSSSPDTAPNPSPKTKTTLFRVDANEELPRGYKTKGDEEVPRGYNTIYVTPDDKRRRERDVSPKGHKFSERPAMSGRGGSSARLPSSRNASYAPDDDGIRPQRLKRAETAYAAPSSSQKASNHSPRHYFGEMPIAEEPYKIVHQSPKIGTQDIRYGRYDRRSSDDAPRDSFPASDFGSRNRPGIERRTTSRVY
ncbi:MAG: hypothetical protein LQ346_002418 [Caloplaca aetnensis]|nr:MAG: hypothetical protein LQ346_002418 [Caloplaca aetnensis]